MPVEEGRDGIERLPISEGCLVGVSRGVLQAVSDPQTSFHHFPLSLWSGLAFTHSLPDISCLLDPQNYLPASQI